MDKAQRVLDRLHEDLLPGMPKTQVESYLKSQEFDNIRGSAPSSISSEYCVTMVANLVEAPGELGTAEVDLEVILEMTVWTPEGEQTHAL